MHTRSQGDAGRLSFTISPKLAGAGFFFFGFPNSPQEKKQAEFVSASLGRGEGKDEKGVL